MATALQLIQCIAAKAAERGVALTRTRLVKFLYLADVFHARNTTGQTFTGWPWRFVHYGPFCGQAVEVINEAVTRGVLLTKILEARDGTDDVTLLFAPKPVSGNTTNWRLPIYIEASLGKAVRLCESGTSTLLEHVYFETEPMETAQPGDLLDFSGCHEVKIDPPVTMLRLSKKKIEQARAALEKMAAAIKPKPPQDPRLFDAAYFEGLAWLDGPAIGEGFSGIAEILPIPQIVEPK